MNFESSKLAAAKALGRRLPKISPASAKYLAILLDDCGFDTHKKKVAFLQRESGRDDIEGVSDMFQTDASRCIDQLKELKERKKNG